MKRGGEHVEDFEGRSPVAQGAEAEDVPHQGRGIARHIDDPPRSPCRYGVELQGVQSPPRGIHYGGRSLQVQSGRERGPDGEGKPLDLDPVRLRVAAEVVKSDRAPLDGGDVASLE